MTLLDLAPTARAAAPDPCASRELLTIEEARGRAAAYVRRLRGIETCRIGAAAGRVTADDVAARMAIPPFTQSAMDGYALLAGSGVPAGSAWRLAGRAAAGATAPGLVPGACVRIFTGAPLPIGADAVVMQEHVQRTGDEVVLLRDLRAGDNVRPRGEDVDPPAMLIAAGTRLDARHVGLMAAQGIETVGAVRRPRVAILSTGDELRAPGEALGPAGIHDANRPMLLALVRSVGLEGIDGGTVPDDPGAIARRLAELAASSDLVVTSGGASVGEEDHSASALELAGGRGETLRIALKPGKPAVVGRIGTAGYLGLPGNPVSALVSWLVLGQAMIAALTGETRARRGTPMTCLSAFARRPGRAEFLPARLASCPARGLGVEVLGRGGSARLRPFAEADGLAEVHAENGGLKPGDLVTFHPFDRGFAV